MQTRRNPFRTYAPLYFDAFYLVLISDQSASVLQQDSLAFSELSQASKMEPFAKTITRKSYFPVENL